MDLEFGPDGALYVLDYGTGFGTGDANSALYRIEHVAGGRPPVAVARATPTSGAAPLTVRFSSAGSTDPDGDRLGFAWDFDGNGTTDSTAATPTHTYHATGTYAARLTVRDRQRKSATATVTVVVGNTAPTVQLIEPANGQVFAFGDEVWFEVAVTDPEDGPVACSRVRVDFLLGHDAHGHLISSANGCAGAIRTVADGDHGDGSNLFGVWTASYTDGGGLTGTDQHVAQPATRQAEHFTAKRGVRPINHATAYGGRTVGAIENGDWISFRPYDLRRVVGFVARVSSAGAGGTLELRLDSPGGRLLGSAKVPVTGGWDRFTEVSGKVAGREGTHTLYLRFKGGKGTLFDVDEFTLVRG
jgi:PKD repeat protein